MAARGAGYPRLSLAQLEAGPPGRPPRLLVTPSEPGTEAARRRAAESGLLAVQLRTSRGPRAKTVDPREVGRPQAAVEAASSRFDGVPARARVIASVWFREGERAEAEAALRAAVGRAVAEVEAALAGAREWAEGKRKSDG